MKRKISGVTVQLSSADELTEIVTQRSWITHQSLDVGEVVLSLDPRAKPTLPPETASEHSPAAGPDPTRAAHRESSQTSGWRFWNCASLHPRRALRSAARWCPYGAELRKWSPARARAG
jgi:hypothetical protein